MSKKYYLFLILIFVTFWAGNGYLKTSNPNITWLDKNAIKRKIDIPTNYSFSDSTSIYCWAKPKKIPIFYKIDKASWDIIETSKETIKNKYDYIADILWTKQAGWILYVEDFNKKLKDYRANSIEFSGDIINKQLFELELESKSNFVNNGYGFNSDSSTVTFYATLYNKKEDKVMYYVSCFNFKTMDKLWSKNYVYPYEIESKKYVGDNIYINRYGEPQILTKVYFTKNRKEKTTNEAGEKEANYMYKFFIAKKDGTIQEYNIENKGKFIGSITLPMDNTKNPVICAYTFDKNQTLTGMIFKEIDLDAAKIIDVKDIDLKSEKLTVFNDQTGEEIKQKDNFEETDNLRIHQVIRTPDAIYVIGENNYYYQVCTQTRYGMYCVDYVQSGNILVTKINNSGKEEWSKIIPKSQQVQRYQGAESIYCFEQDGNIHIFYNDNEKNYQADVKKIKVWHGNKTVFVHTTVNSSGSYKAEVALTDDDMPDYTFMPSVKKMDNNFIFFFNGKSLGKLKFN